MRRGWVAAAIALATLPGATAAARGRSCVETSRVVGYRHCSRSGGWSTGERPRIAVGVGFGARWLTGLGGPLTGSAVGTAGLVDYALTSDRLGPGSLVVAVHSFRLEFFIARGFYWTAEFHVGGGAFRPMSAIQIDGNASLLPVNLLFVAGMTAAGYEWSSSTFQVAGELAFGVGGALMEFAGRTGEALRSTVATRDLWSLEARVALGVWLLPGLSAGVRLGIQAYPEVSPSVGLYIQGHARAFDGLFDR